MSEPILLLLSGPNLNLLGEREPETYGSETLEEHVQAAINKAAEIGFLLEHFQSNHEGELVDSIHAARNRCSLSWLRVKPWKAPRDFGSVCGVRFP